MDQDEPNTSEAGRRKARADGLLFVPDGIRGYAAGTVLSGDVFLLGIGGAEQTG